MKYNELERLLVSAGCRKTEKQWAGHPLWYSPITGKLFTTSNHGKQEVAAGTLKSIKRDSGVNF